MPVEERLRQLEAEGTSSSRSGRGETTTMPPELETAAQFRACLTCDTFEEMGEVTIRELRNHGGEVIERVEAGEHLTVTRAGQPVAELHPVRRRPATAATLLERWSKLPRIDPVAFRADIDRLLDSSL